MLETLEGTTSDARISRESSPFNTLSDVRAANRAIGNNWFDRGTMRWWKSRLESGLITRRYFISSEDEFAIDGRQPKRIFAVRYANDDGSIKTIKSHLADKDDARELIRRLSGR